MYLAVFFSQVKNIYTQNKPFSFHDSHTLPRAYLRPFALPSDPSPALPTLPLLMGLQNSKAEPRISSSSILGGSPPQVQDHSSQPSVRLFANYPASRLVSPPAWEQPVSFHL